MLPTSRPFFYARKPSSRVPLYRFLDFTFGEVQRQRCNKRFVLYMSCLLEKKRRIYATIGLIYQGYRIIYLLKSDNVFVVTILHGSRDLAAGELKPWDVV